MERLNTKRILITLFIPISNFVYFFIVKNNIYYFAIRKDQYQHHISAKKMFYLNESFFRTSVDQHSPLLKKYYQIVYGISENFFNETQILFIQHVVFYILLNFAIYYFLDALKINTLNCILFSTVLTVSLSFNNLTHRVFGTLIFIIALIFLFKFLNTLNFVYLFFFEFMLVLNTYNLESYFIDFLALNLIFLIMKVNNKNEVYKFIFIYTLLSSALISAVHIFVNKDLLDLFKYTLIWHLRIPMSRSSDRIYEYITFNSSDVYAIIFIINIVIFIYIFIKKESDIFYKIFFLIFISRFLQIIITGRSAYYGYLLIIPELLVISYFINQKLSKSLVKTISKLVFISLIAIPVVYRINFESSPSTLTTSNLNLTESLELEYQEVVLTWIQSSSWEEIYINNNTLPSTRYWWYFNMRFNQKDLYTFVNDEDLSLLEKLLVEDLEAENPRYFIQQKNYYELPLMLKNYVDLNFTYFKTIDNFLIFRSDK